MALMATSRTRFSRLMTTFLQKSYVSGSGFSSSDPKIRFLSSSSSAAVAQQQNEAESHLGFKDYYDYRRSLYGDITHKAVLVDAVGTLVVPAQPMAQVCSVACFCLLLVF